MLKLTKKADYGLIALRHLAVARPRASASAKDIADSYRIPLPLLSKVLQKLARGVELRDYSTKPARAECIAEPAWLWPRNPPVRFRKNIPTSWLSLSIAEGKNRQVRHMTAAVGLPTLRLVRYAVGNWTIDGLAPGQWREINANPATRATAQMQRSRK